MSKKLIVDGIPGPSTVSALKEAGYTDGIWTLGKVVVEPSVPVSVPPPAPPAEPEKVPTEACLGCCPVHCSPKDGWVKKFLRSLLTSKND